LLFPKTPDGGRLSELRLKWEGVEGKRVTRSPHKRQGVSWTH